MNPKILDKIKEVFLNHNGFARTKDIASYGINKANIKILLDENKIRKIKKGLYKWNGYDFANEIIDVSKLIPKGVICLTSALAFYNLTTYTPNEYHVAIRRDMKVTKPIYPPIKLYYFSQKYFESGIDIVNIEGNNVRIYNMEKTICDCLRYPKYVGKDIIIEAVKTYAQLENKSIDKLLTYATVSKLKNDLVKYLEVLLND